MPVVIGIDYGLRRTGIAISDAEGRIALPLTVHVAGRDGSLIAMLRGVAGERGAAEVVIGLPLRTDGSRGDMAARVERFAARLQADLELPVILLDERYTSREASRWIGLRGRPARRGEVDAVAAQIILQEYLDRPPTDRRPPVRPEGQP